MTQSENPIAEQRSSAERLAALRGAEAGWEPPERVSPQEATAPLPIVRERPRWWGRLPSWRARSASRKVRLDPGRRGALVLASVAGVAALISAFGVLRDQPVAQEAPPLVGYTQAGGTGVTTPAGRGAPLATSPRTGPLVISVVGKVRHPGLVSVPEGSRVADAIGKAGGALRGADLTTVNLARRVGDGEQIAVGVPNLAPGSLVGPTGAGTATRDPVSGGGLLDLNQATVAQLDGLPGIGPVTAQRIVDWRTQHGQFRSVGQLREVQGIGDRRLGQLKSLVTVAGGPAR